MTSGTTEGSFPQQRLDSWKSIARHFGRSCRTVQRWHSEYALPIRRLGGDKGAIFAYADELDDWMRNRGRPLTNEPPEIPRPVPLHALLVREESDHRNGILDFSLISSPAKARSAELVALAYKMWEALSYSNLRVIARHFREAIDLDPGNAAAFAGLSNALIAGGFLGSVSAPAAYASARAALQKALEIDSELLEAKSAAAWLKLVLKRDWQGAGRGFDEVLKHQPSCTSSMVGRAMLHIAEGCLKEASALLLEAAEQHALSTPATALHCWSEYLAGEYTNALFQIEQARASGQFGLVFDAVEALASIQLEEPDAQIERIESLAADSPHHDVLRGALGYAYGVTGQDQRARELLDAVTNPGTGSKSREPYAIALLLIGLNERRKAVQWLERSYREGSLWSLGFPSDPILAPLRNDPYYQLFMSKAGYPVPENADSLLFSAS